METLLAVVAFLFLLTASPAWGIMEELAPGKYHLFGGLIFT